MSTPGLARRLVASAALGLVALGAVGVATQAPEAPVALSGTSSAAGTWSAATSAARTTGSSAGSYAFSTVLDGKPVRWNPCEEIRWTADVRKAPAGGLKVLSESVARVAALTGTRWKYMGTTKTVPTSRVLPKTAVATYPPIVIGWTDGASSDLLKGQPKNVLGMTRTAWFGVQTADGRKYAAERAAVIALDRTDRLPLRGPTSWSAVVRHELAHAMGLAHVNDRRQLMATLLPRTLTDLQAGDRTGLSKLGRAAGCVHVPS